MLKLPTLLAALSLALVPALPAAAQLGLSGDFTASRLSHPPGPLGSPTLLYGETVSVYYQRGTFFALGGDARASFLGGSGISLNSWGHRPPHRLQAPRPSAAGLRRGPRRLQQLHRRSLPRQHDPCRISAHRRRRLHHLSPHRLARRGVHLHRRLRRPQLELAQHRHRHPSPLVTWLMPEATPRPQANAFRLIAVHPRSPPIPVERLAAPRDCSTTTPTTTPTTLRIRFDIRPRRPFRR